MSARAQTRVLDPRGTTRALLRQQLEISVQEGTDRGKRFELKKGLVRLGAHPSNDVVLNDDAVSLHHAELEINDEGVTVRDLDSTNGTFCGRCRIKVGMLEPGALLQLGETVLRLNTAGSYEVPLGPQGLGGIIGDSLAIREVTALLPRFAQSTAPVLLTGETGVGKELFAQALHKLSPRAEGPFEVFDCSAATPALVEAHLFGHARGAVPGATEDRPGAFERAQGGTLFLDEIGELPLELQPRLLRAIETGEVRRVGSNRPIATDARVIAATQRDLGEMVTAGQFRSDLYYRLHVLRLEIPPLRRRKEDIQALAEHILVSVGRPAQLRPDTLALLRSYDWPGNVRELRNVLLRAGTVTEGPITPNDLIFDSPPSGESSDPDMLGLPYAAAKELLVERFERTYVERLLERHGGRISEAANAAQFARQTLYRLMLRHNLQARGKE